MNGLTINSFKATAPCLAGIAREDLVRGVSPGEADIPLLVEISPRWPDSCIASPLSVSRLLEDIPPSDLRSSKIPLPDPWAPHCSSVGPFREVNSCYMSSPSPLQHLRPCNCFFYADHFSNLDVSNLHIVLTTANQFCFPAPSQFTGCRTKWPPANRKTQLRI